MATSVTARVMVFGDGVTNAAQDLRLGNSAQMTALGTAGSTGMAARSGVRLTGVGTPLAVSAGSGMAVGVAVGQAFIGSTSGDSFGQYLLNLDTAATLTVATSDPTNPRIDLVVAQITDVGSSSSTATVNIITGTPAPSPAVPALPASSVALGQVTVPANATSIVTGNVTDARQWTTALGGIVPVASSTAYPTNGATSDYAHNLASGRLMRSNGTTLVAPKVAGFAPVTSSSPTPVTCTTSATPIASVTFTVDGLTEVEIVAKWPGYSMAAVVANAQLGMFVFLDSARLDGWYLSMPSGIGNNIAFGGGSCPLYCVPAAGAHTVTWYGLVSGTSNPMKVAADSGSFITLRAQATLL
jgi:hypothetical protein